MSHRVLAFVSLALIFAAPVSAAAQGPGKGFILEKVGTITTSPGEVLSGQASIKGEYSGAELYSAILKTNPGVFPLTAGSTYEVSFRYRILRAPTNGFEVIFYSPTGGRQGSFLPGRIISGSAGDTGSVTLTNALGPYTDYEVRWNVRATGAIVVDDVELRHNGTIVAVEHGEGPLIQSGPLNFQVTHTTSIEPRPAGQAYNVRSAAVLPLNGDATSHLVLSVTSRPDQLPTRPIVIDASTDIRIETDTVFVNGAPTLRHSPITLFVDINADAIRDLLFADAGLDHPPWTGSRIGVALGESTGGYRDVSDLLVTGQADHPNTRILFGSASGFRESGLVVLPDGPFGHYTQAAIQDPNVPVAHGAAARQVVADFNNDGWLDIVELQEQVSNYKPGVITDTNVPNYAEIRANGGIVSGDFALQVLINNGARQFVDRSSASTRINLGKTHYTALMAVDLNLDGFLDVIGVFHTRAYGTDPGRASGTTFFLNDGTGAFRVIDGTQLLPWQRRILLDPVSSGVSGRFSQSRSSPVASKVSSLIWSTAVS